MASGIMIGMIYFANQSSIFREGEAPAEPLWAKWLGRSLALPAK